MDIQIHVPSLNVKQWLSGLYKEQPSHNWFERRTGCHVPINSENNADRYLSGSPVGHPDKRLTQTLNK
jgi:hypothetical protein